MISSKHVPWHQAPTWARVLNEKMDLLLEGNGNIMSTLADLTTQLNAISVDVTTVGNDVQTLLAKLAAIPPAGLTAAQQAALDAAVATATNIAASLSAIDISTHPIAPGPMPVLTSISPNTGPATGNTSVTLTGTGFTGATGVSIDNVLMTNMTVVSDTSITATTPAGPAGAQSVIVSTPNGSNVANTLFTYTAVAPVLTSVLPTTAAVAGGTAIALTGSGFTGATSVTIGGITTPFTVVNDTSITLTTLTGAAGAMPVVVTTPAGVTDGTVSITLA
jgi:IPT/TIG domain